ncbi:MAG: hypothetical protein ACOCXZ_00120 [Chloroflexota bacterium]
MQTAIAHAVARYGPHLPPGMTILRRDDTPYPCTIQPAHPAQTIDDLLGRLDNRLLRLTDYALHDGDHLVARQADRLLTNGLCYAFDRLHTDPPRLDGALGRYFDMMATCDALDHELRRGNGTPMRDHLHALVPPGEALRSGRGRCALIGGAVLLAFRRADDYHLLLGQRSATLATGAGLLHVLPAFMMQPTNDEQPVSGWSLRDQIIREFAEELFGVPEGLPPQALAAQPPAADLLALLNDGQAELVPTGIAFNLLSLRPEVCALLIIHDTGWHTRHADGLAAAAHTERQSTLTIPLATLAGLPHDLPTRMTPQGAAALWLGVDRARHLAR